MKWITREKPKIDRIACPWLIVNFIDRDAEFMYVPFDRVLEEAKANQAIPFDIPGVELTHKGDQCTFDALIKKYRLKDPALDTLAVIVRAADTDHHELSLQAPGLWAISAGLAYNFQDDHELLAKGMTIYDALYSWAKNLQHVQHTQQPFENTLLNVLTNLKPAWAIALREMIQDQIDTGITLKELSKSLDINPSYLSREFSRHFQNLSFGEYVRKQRIDRSVELMRNPDYSLTEIAYLSGFSDQSHFTRIFKKLNGQSPSAYRKKLLKSNKSPNE
ncbi:chromate resistance protein ChrB domain-containing protein [Flavihumibacter solisilvae]|uniref:AraC family transcriptional regulator n=1 Tax=Flavihumibacter solisilvae TaxID=1349421 RepID=A0A0C1L9I3_9BACT|nr:chromate resistance protein ChrB domain-containing protein [Flavihumibacter solisilvae]KIC96171.1 AraC family transcriptional regulator [Flavihumibacter solisilvae]